MVDILLIEDNTELANLIKTFLLQDGYLVTIINSGEEALAFLEKEKVKLVLLDIMLPGIDGFFVCSKIRESSIIPIMIMSARVAKEDQINGFIQGADDYIEKPVDIDILKAKINALMKRNYELKAKNKILSSGSICLDLDASCVFLDQVLIPMTGKEYELLTIFAKNPGKTLHKDYLFHQIWGADSFSENQTLTVHVKMLRDKIEADPKNPKRITTVWGVGYKYEEI